MTRVWVVFIFLGALLGCDKKDVKPTNGNFAIDVGNSVIPYIVIQTSTPILNEPKVPGTMDIWVEKEMVQRQTIGIEYRGSTSFRITDKKSFGIETWDVDGNDVDVSILGFPAEEDWILQGHVVNLTDQFIIDRTLMYNYIGYNLFTQMGQYAVRNKFVEVEINDEYMGVYLFMEKPKRDNNRIDISRLDAMDTDITGGYILKIDKTSGGEQGIVEDQNYYLTNWADDARYTESNSFRSKYDIYQNLVDFPAYGEPYHNLQFLETYFLYEYPKEENITVEQKTYIQDYIETFETALITDDFGSNTRTYTSYIDMSSFVDFFIINEVCRNVDGYRLSTFLYKDRGGLLKLGPIWDLNIGFDSGGRIPWDGWVINYNQYVSQDPWMMPFWWPRLLEDPIFRNAVKVRWGVLRSNVLNTTNVLALVDQKSNDLISNGAVYRNYELWDKGINVNYEESIQNLKDFLEYRLNWMDGEISNF